MMRNSNLGVTRADFKPRGTKTSVTNPPPWARELLDELAEGEPVRMKRWEARNFRRALFGPEGLRDVPRGKGTRTFRLPSGEPLRFQYEPRRTPEELAQINLYMERYGGTWFAEDEARNAQYVTVTLLRAAAASTLAAAVAA
jgi:hypothetical protein